MTLDPTMLLYTYISRFSVTPHYIKSGRVAATNAVPQPFLIAVSTSRTNGPRLLSRVKAGTHSPSPTGSHTAAYTPKQGTFRMGRYHYPRHELHVHEHPRAGCQNGKLCRFWVLVGRCSRRTQRACGTAMRLCASLFQGVAAPLGCVIFFRFCRNYGFHTLCSGLSACARRGALSLPSARFACSRNAGRPLVKKAHLPFSEVDGHCSPRDAYFLANIQVSLSVISVANVFALWYDKSYKSGLFGDEGEPE